MGSSRRNQLKRPEKAWWKTLTPELSLMEQIGSSSLQLLGCEVKCKRGSERANLGKDKPVLLETKRPWPKDCYHHRNKQTEWGRGLLPIPKAKAKVIQFTATQVAWWGKWWDGVFICQSWKRRVLIISSHGIWHEGGVDSRCEKAVVSTSTVLNLRVELGAMLRKQGEIRYESWPPHNSEWNQREECELRRGKEKEQKSPNIPCQN